MPYRKIKMSSRRAQQEEFDLEHEKKKFSVGDPESRRLKRGEFLKKILKETLLKILGKEDLEEERRLPKNHLDIRLLHVNKVVTRK